MKIKELNIKTFFISLLALMAVTVSSCTSTTDEPAVAPDDKDDNPGVYYFAMSVRAADDSGFDVENPDYVDGTAFEHAIDFSGKSTNVVIFLSDDYKYAGYSPLEFDRESAQGTPSTNGAQEVTFIGFLRPDYHDAYVLPRLGVMILNAYDILPELNRMLLDPTADISSVLALVDASTDSHIAGRSGNYFTMASTAFLVKESNEWVHSLVFEIDRNKIFETRAQAIISPAFTAYVERMSSKFSLKITGAYSNDGLSFRPSGGREQVIVCHYTDGQPNYNNRSWTCTVTGWGVNKYEPTQYYFRNIVGETTDVTSYPFHYGTDISVTNQPFFNGWNRTVDRRAFWAVDPNYDDGIFPAQYRPAVDKMSIEYYGQKGPASLAYISYNELSTDFHELNSEDGVSLYSTENTFPDTRMGALWQHDLAASELVIGAQVHIANVSETKADYDLYRNRLGIFYPSTSDFATYFISTFNNQLNSQSNMTFRYYDWSNPENNTDALMHSVAITHSNFRLYYGNQPLTPEIMSKLAAIYIPATIENGDGKVIPWVPGMYIARREIDPSTHEEIGDIKRLEINENDFKSLIYDWIGPFDHFNKGRMVYSVPVRYRASEEKVSSGTYRPTVGDYGVVRNTWYKFELLEINSLGNPVDDLNQKIIPYQASLENSVLMEIKVLDWHQFETTVVLPGTSN